MRFSVNRFALDVRNAAAATLLSLPILLTSCAPDSSVQAMDSGCLPVPVNGKDIAALPVEGSDQTMYRNRGAAMVVLELRGGTALTPRRLILGPTGNIVLHGNINVIGAYICLSQGSAQQFVEGQ